MIVNFAQKGPNCPCGGFVRVDTLTELFDAVLYLARHGMKTWIEYD